MNNYESPIAEVIIFSATDVILASGMSRPGDVDDDYDAVVPTGNTPV